MLILVRDVRGGDETEFRPCSSVLHTFDSFCSNDDLSITCPHRKILRIELITVLFDSSDFIEG